jgi:hypothetical protein
VLKLQPQVVQLLERLLQLVVQLLVLQPVLPGVLRLELQLVLLEVLQLVLRLEQLPQLQPQRQLPQLQQLLLHPGQLLEQEVVQPVVHQLVQLLDRGVSQSVQLSALAFRCFRKGD